MAAKEKYAEAVHVRISVDDAALLYRVAEDDNDTLSGLVRDAIHVYLVKRGLFTAGGKLRKAIVDVS